MVIIGTCRECSCETLDGLCVHCTQRENNELRTTVARLQGAMAAQDRREHAAGEKCGVSYHEEGCDWPDAVSDVVLSLRKEIAELQGNLASVYAANAELGTDAVRLRCGLQKIADMRNPPRGTSLFVEDAADIADAVLSGADVLAEETDNDDLL